MILDSSSNFKTALSEVCPNFQYVLDACKTHNDNGDYDWCYNSYNAIGYLVILVREEEELWARLEGMPSGGYYWIQPIMRIHHKDWIWDVAWSPCLSPTVQRVASCSEDRTVLIWTLDMSGVNNDGEKEQQQKEEEEKKDVGSSKNNKKKPMWVPQLLHTFEDPVWRVSWSLTGNILAVSSGDDSVTLWKQTLDGTWMQVSSVLDEQQQQSKSAGGSGD
jgi:WD domain, G-beta repeat.